MFIDIVVLLIIILSVMFGLKKGFVLEFFALFGVFITVLLSKGLMPTVVKLTDQPTGTKYVMVYISLFLWVRETFPIRRVLSENGIIVDASVSYFRGLIYII